MATSAAAELHAPAAAALRPSARPAAPNAAITAAAMRGNAIGATTTADGILCRLVCQPQSCDRGAGGFRSVLQVADNSRRRLGSKLFVGELRLGLGQVLLQALAFFLPSPVGWPCRE